MERYFILPNGHLIVCCVIGCKHCKSNHGGRETEREEAVSVIAKEEERAINPDARERCLLNDIRRRLGQQPLAEPDRDETLGLVTRSIQAERNAALLAEQRAMEMKKFFVDLRKTDHEGTCRATTQLVDAFMNRMAAPNESLEDKSSPERGECSKCGKPQGSHFFEMNSTLGHCAKCGEPMQFSDGICFKCNGGRDPGE